MLWPQMGDCEGTQLRLVPYKPFQARFLGSTRSYARSLGSDLLDVGLDGFAEWRSFRRGAVDEDTAVHLRLYIARPSFSVLARAQSFGDRRPAGAPNLRMPLLGSFLSNSSHRISPHARSQLCQNCAATPCKDQEPLSGNT